MFFLGGFFKYNLRLIGFEPITVGTEIRNSIQLSYKRCSFCFNKK